MKKHKINLDFFKNFSTEIQAYILGLLYSDGNIQLRGNSYLISFCLISKRKALVELVNEYLTNSTISIIEEKRKVGNNCFKISFMNKEIGKDLILLGCVPNKSLILQFPTFINESLIPHFIRGLFDGDGCIWDGKRHLKTVKDKFTKSGYRTRIIHNVKFTYTGNYGFVNSLLDYLVDKLNIKKTKLNFSKAKNSNNISASVCSMEYSGRNNIKKFYNYIYKDASFYEINKYNKFLEIFCAFSEKSLNETSLIAGTPEMVISSQDLK